MIDTLIVLAKAPRAGRAKTRLVPPLSYAQAATVAAASLTNTLDAVTGATARRRLLAFDAPTGRWLRTGWRSCHQPAGGLDARIVAAFDAVGADPALLLGMDTPQLTARHLQAFDPERYDACLGRARDGGYWAIGLRDPRLAAAAVLGVPMSAPHTGRVQLRRLHQLGLRVQLLNELSDVDTFDDALQVAALVPDTAFAHAVAAVHPVAAGLVS